LPYIDAYQWFDTKLCPQEGEGYSAFMERCVPAIMALEPDMTPESANDLCNEAWGAHILKNASEVTVSMKRDFHYYSDVYGVEGWWGDWRITGVHQASLPQFNITYSAVEKARAATGEVFKIAKSAEDEQLVFGWANIAIDENGEYPLDWDGDITAPEDLEKAAYEFVLKYRATGEQHQGEIKGQLVESVMFTKQKQAAMGIPEGVIPEGWWVGFHVPDTEVFAKIKSGEYEMFSVEGSAKRQPTGA
jgi:hypothetical protein